MGKAKKKRSQAPVALVYVITLLVFMGAFGYIAYRLIKQMDSWKKGDTESQVEADPSFNLLFARTDKTGSLKDAAVIRFSPEESKVIIMPVSSHTVNSENGTTIDEVYSAGGIRQLEKSIESIFGIKVDNYLTVSTAGFETVADIIGGMVYTPQEDLYKLAEKDADDISYQAGKAVDMSGHMVTQILGTKVFSNGYKGNLDFLGMILEQLVNNAFQQSNFTKTSLENIYTQLTEGGDTDYTKNEFSDDKTNINAMLDKRLNKPAVLMVPDGEWREDDRFIPATTFINDLKEVFGGKSSKGASAFGSSDSQTDAQAGTSEAGTAAQTTAAQTAAAEAVTEATTADKPADGQ